MNQLHHLQVGPAAMFLSQTPIQQYYTAEEGYTTQLTAFTRKQFFQVGLSTGVLKLDIVCLCNTISLIISFNIIR